MRPVMYWGYLWLWQVQVQPNVPGGYLWHSPHLRDNQFPSEKKWYKYKTACDLAVTSL